MRKNGDMAKQFQEFFAKNIQKNHFENCDIFVCRSDGILLYHRDGPFKTSQQRDSLGALISGMCQAASGLFANFSSQIENKKPKDVSGEEENYRLSFDTSSKGVYVLPFLLGNNDYYFGIIYSQETNPGQMKSKLREILARLQFYFEENKFMDEIKQSNQFLFSDITDKEIDQLFSSSTSIQLRS